jgi:hypothetical protein
MSTGNLTRCYYRDLSCWSTATALTRTSVPQSPDHSQTPVAEPIRTSSPQPHGSVIASPANLISGPILNGRVEIPIGACGAVAPHYPRVPSRRLSDDGPRSIRRHDAHRGLFRPARKVQRRHETYVRTLSSGRGLGRLACESDAKEHAHISTQPGVPQTGLPWCARRREAPQTVIPRAGRTRSARQASWPQPRSQ